jgi:hypothetical protein
MNKKKGLGNNPQSLPRKLKTTLWNNDVIEQI